MKILDVGGGWGSFTLFAVCFGNQVHQDRVIQLKPVL